jgi:hypothetical protein
LISKGDVLFLYRPCIEENAAEEVIFGTASSCITSTTISTSTSFDSIRDVYRRADHLDPFDETTHHPPFHFLYGSSSTILKIKQSNGHLHSQEQSSPELYPLKIPSLCGQPQPTDDHQLKNHLLNKKKQKKLISIFGQVISIEDNPLVSGELGGPFGTPLRS